MVRLTNTSPYSVAGAFPKTGGGFDFLPITLKAGTHHLTVTAYGGTNATGLASDPYVITFTVIADKAFRVPAATVESAKPPATFRVAPNPFSGHTSLLFTSAGGVGASVEVFSPQGVLLERVYEGVVEAGKPYAWEFNAQSLPAGVYISRVRMGTQIHYQKIVLLIPPSQHGSLTCDGWYFSLILTFRVFH